MASLDGFPDEILRQILVYVSPEDLFFNIQPASRRLHRIGNDPFLWKNHCVNSFVYWREHHRFREKLDQPVLATDWRALWHTRHRGNRKVARLLNGIIRTKVGQVERTEGIAELGIDAKDYLLAQVHADDSHEDVLARRYYAQTTLDSLHRGMAVDIWSQYQDKPGSFDGLARACGAFDLFFLYDQPQDLDYIERTLDGYALQFIQDNPDFQQFSPREKAIVLVRWLRAKKYVGSEMPHDEYRNLKNCLIGHALSEEPHASLPIIASAIYVSVATRLGLTAACVAIPGHVLAGVLAPPGQDLDGNPVNETSTSVEQNLLYLDPWSSDAETRGLFFIPDPTPVSEIVQRIGRNMLETSRLVSPDSLVEDRQGQLNRICRLRTGIPIHNLQRIPYAPLWAELMTMDVNDHNWDMQVQTFLLTYAPTWMVDNWIVKRYLEPRHHARLRTEPHHPGFTGWKSVPDIIKLVENLDARPCVPNRRYTEEMRSAVRYKIGQVFVHKTRSFIGIINGWSCGSTELPPHETMADVSFSTTHPPYGITRGPDPENDSQSIYYTCLKAPSIYRIKVAQDNIEIISDPARIPPECFLVAGKFFRRFDKDTCTFVSNIKDLYPDD
ncbi:hypothetical protein QBC35DRAFT_409613 [Podospora australis]|uniref:F-box domain-containing protein n=1 Tax=Podospora australis TaxID=1536484 RepID=A0AAN6WV28_9PEZI|nr:hypothetical protein QBC35DRAFT_409613 [Podospora australis]